MNAKLILSTLGAFCGLSLMVGTLTGAEVTAYQEGFETDGNGSRYFVDGEGDDGQLAFFARRMLGSIGVDASGGTVEGDWIFGVSDLDALPQTRVEDFPELNARKGRLRFENIPVEGLGNLRFTMAAATGEGTTEADNDLFISVRFDDGEWVDIGGFKSASSNNPPKYYTGPRTTVTIESATPLLSFFLDWDWPIIGSGTTLDIAMVIDSNWIEEDYFLDNIRVIGDNAVNLASASFETAEVDEPDAGSPLSNPVTITLEAVAPAGGVTFEVNSTREGNNSVNFPDPLTIPAGQTSATFAAEVVQDGGFTGTEVDDFLFSAAGYNTALARVTITNTTPEPTNLVIMEIHNVTPGDSVEDLHGDANNDGIRSSSADQFIEIVNFEEFPIDLTGWGVGEEIGIRHIFPEGTILQPNSALVLFGNGNPRGAFAGALVQVSSSGGNGLGFDRNSGPDAAFLSAPFGFRLEEIDMPQLTAIQAVTGLLPESNPAFNQGASVHRTSDSRASEFTVHPVIEGANNALFSPGSRPDGSPYFTPENTLGLELSVATIAEDAGDGAVTATLTLGTAAPTGGLEVTIDTDGVVVNSDGSFDPDEITLDSLTVMVPEGQTTTTFSIGAHDDGILDGDKIVSITVRSGAYVLPDFAALTVTDVADSDLSLVINEVFIDVVGGGFDVNLDGILEDEAGDQFVEIVNVSGREVNIGGWELWWNDNSVFAVDTYVHTFPPGTVVPDQGSIVVIGAITSENSADPVFGNAIVQKALLPEGGRNFNGLDITVGLVQGDYLVRLQNEHGFIVDQVEFLAPLAGSQNQSVTRDPDITGAEFFLHQEVSLAFLAFSPGLTSGGEPFEGNRVPASLILGGAPVPDVENWWVSDWFGYFNTLFEPWLFHSAHGFIYLNLGSTTNNDLYFYDPPMGAWWWTNVDNYPFLYAFNPGPDNSGVDVDVGWLFYFDDNVSPRSFATLDSTFLSFDMSL